MTHFFKSQRALRPLSILATVAVVAVTTGCVGPGYGVPAYGSAPSYSGQVYRAGEAQREQNVRFATIESVREVTIDKGQTGIGAIGGAIAGGLLGNVAGAGRGKALATVGGAVLGGVGGSALESHLDQQRALELTVRLDSGETRAIVQAADDYFRAGDRVRVLREGNTTRVTH